MELQRFTRNPVEVVAVQVTPTNVAAVANWCNGTLVEADYWLVGRTHKLGAIQLKKQGPKGDKTMTVMIGSWITKHRNIFKAWKDEAFSKSYSPIGTGFKVGDLARANNDSPFYGWEGKIADPHLIGVDFGERGKVVFEPHWLDKIDEMSSEQLQLNAGVEGNANIMGADPMKAVLDEMREASKERIAALEQENLKYDEVIRVGDLVKIVKHPQLSQMPVNFGQCGHVKMIEDVPSADGPTKDYWVEFATADPENPERVPYELVCLEKLRQDGETLNLEWEPGQDENNLEGWELSGLDRLNDEKALPTRQRVQINAERSPYNRMFGTIRIVENPDVYVVSIDGHDDGEGMLRFCRNELIPQHEMTEGVVSINDLREDLGMPRVPELEGVAADPRAIENHRLIKETLGGMTPEEAEKVKQEIVELQKVIGNAVDAVSFANKPFVEKACSVCSILSWDSKTGSYNHTHWDPKTETQVPCNWDGAVHEDFGPQDPSEVPGPKLSDFAENDMVETTTEYELDGVQLPAGTTGKVTVVGCDLEGSHLPGIEVMFSDGHYGRFLPIELKKI